MGNYNVPVESLAVVAAGTCIPVVEPLRKYLLAD
jgi:hypothetical protein